MVSVGISKARLRLFTEAKAVSRSSCTPSAVGRLLDQGMCAPPPPPCPHEAKVSCPTLSLIGYRGRFIAALGVPLVGARTAELMAEHFEDDFEAWWGALKR